MAELKAGSWPITDVDVDAIDPDEEFIPRGPEADKEAAKDWRPWGLEDRSDNTNIKKEWVPSDEGKYNTIDDDYLNKEPSTTMKESHLDSNTIYRTKARLKSQGIDVEPSMVANYLEGTQRVHKLNTWTNRQLAADYKNYLSFRETKTKDKYMSKLKEKIREAIEDAAIDVQEWDAGDVDEIDLDDGVTEIVLDDAAIDRLAKTLGVDSQVIRDCALAEEDGAYSYEEDDFVDSMTDTFMGDDNGYDWGDAGVYESGLSDEDSDWGKGLDPDDDRDISDMPHHSATDWDDTEDPSFNSDFMESRSRARDQRVREGRKYVDKASPKLYTAASDGGDDADGDTIMDVRNDVTRPSTSDDGDGDGFDDIGDNGGGGGRVKLRRSVAESKRRRGRRRVREADDEQDPQQDNANSSDPAALRYPSVSPDQQNDEEESSREAVDTEGQSSLPVYLDYDSSEDTEFSSGLDSFQHTKGAPAPEMTTEAVGKRGHSKQDKLLRERFAKEQTRLREARGQKAEVVNQYLSQASNPDYDEFIEWAQNQGIQEVPNKYYFNNLLKKRGGTGSGGAIEVEEREPFNPEDAPEELQQLMNLYSQASDEDASLEPSVEDKFKGIYAIGYRTAKGRALKRHAFICGSPGIGKTFTVAKAVEKGATEGKQMFAKFRGSIGKSLSAILAFLWMHRENYVILLDDADGFLTGSSDEVMNTLKAAMDTDEPMVSTSSPHIRKNVAKMVGLNESERWSGALNFDTSRLHEGIITAVDRDGNVLAEEVLDDSEQRFWEEFTNANQPKSDTQSFLESSLYNGDVRPRIQEGFFDDDEEEEGNDLGLEDEIEEDEEEGEKMLPAQFEFGSRIIFISNMMQADIPDAIAGRCNVKELYLTRPEIMLRLEQILPELLKNESAYGPEELTWAKANVFRWMKAVVLADDMGAPLTLASGKTVNVNINVPITFRMFNDFVDAWMQLADEHAMEADESNFDEIEEEIALKFVSQMILPTFRGDLRKKKKKR